MWFLLKGTESIYSSLRVKRLLREVFCYEEDSFWVTLFRQLLPFTRRLCKKETQNIGTKKLSLVEHMP